MNEKKPFGEYIRKKRLEAGLTQKDLAAQLFVTESTVSKWERALSYPDVSMVTAICAALHITEHEFFTACDDDQAHSQEQAAKRWRLMVTGMRRFFAAGYAIALAVCLICDLAVFHALDWFWIVLTAIGLAFCFTNLPFLVRRNKLAVCLGVASGCLILLLLACWAYAGGWWIIGGMCITAACLALPWSWWAVWRFCGKHVLPLCMGVFSLWVFLLLTVIWAFTGGDWLLRLAFPIAAFCVGYGWLFFAAVYWLRIGGWFKAGVCTLLAAFAVPLGNTLSAYMVPAQKTPVLLDYFAWRHMFTHESVNGFSWINVLVFYVMLACSAALFAVGAAKARRRGQAEE